jgi:hypothetical protein
MNRPKSVSGRVGRAGKAYRNTVAEQVRAHNHLHGLAGRDVPLRQEQDRRGLGAARHVKGGRVELVACDVPPSSEACSGVKGAVVSEPTFASWVQVGGSIHTVGQTEVRPRRIRTSGSGLHHSDGETMLPNKHPELVLPDRQTDVRQVAINIPVEPRGHRLLPHFRRFNVAHHCAIGSSERNGLWLPSPPVAKRKTQSRKGRRCVHTRPACCLSWAGVPRAQGERADS